MKKIMFGVLISATISYGGDITLKEPPKSLSKYYPPSSNKMEFLNTMHAMSTAFTGIFTNIQENDWKNAEKWANVLKENYLNIGKLVPEFDKGLKKNEINALFEAVKSKDLEKIKFNSDAVGKSCMQCHQNYQVSTKIIYHYPSFEMINIEDPVSRSTIEFHDYMKKTTDSMKKMRVYLEDGKFDKAQKEGYDFVKRVKGLSQSCNECHNNKLSIEIYQGKDLEENLNLLTKALQNKNKNDVYKAVTWISGNNCSKCHNTHQTIAEIKEKFNK
jgi:cytochrome c556